MTGIPTYCSTPQSSPGPLKYGDLNAIRKTGFEALLEKFGPVDMVESMQQFDSGYGDYTKERYAWLGNTDIETILKQAKAKRE